MSTTTTTASARLARADLLLSLAGALGPPEAGSLARAAQLRGEGAELAGAAGADEAVAAALEALAAAAAETPPDAASAEYRRLFDTAVLCPIHEAGWVRRDKGAILGDVAAFFRAFGIAPRWVAAHPAGSCNATSTIARGCACAIRTRRAGCARAPCARRVVRDPRAGASRGRVDRACATRPVRLARSWSRRSLACRRRRPRRRRPRRTRPRPGSGPSRRERSARVKGRRWTDDALGPRPALDRPVRLVAPRLTPRAGGTAAGRGR